MVFGIGGIFKSPSFRDNNSSAELPLQNPYNFQSGLVTQSSSNYTYFMFVVHLLIRVAISKLFINKARDGKGAKKLTTNQGTNHLTWRLPR